MSTPITNPYTPPPSIGHEIGVMLGFGGAMVLTMASYLAAWKVMQKRAARIEAERREVLAQSYATTGYGEKSPVDGSVDS